MLELPMIFTKNSMMPPEKENLDQIWTKKIDSF